MYLINSIIPIIDQQMPTSERSNKFQFVVNYSEVFRETLKRI